MSQFALIFLYKWYIPLFLVFLILCCVVKVFRLSVMSSLLIGLLLLSYPYYDFLVSINEVAINSEASDFLVYLNSDPGFVIYSMADSYIYEPLIYLYFLWLDFFGFSRYNQILFLQFFIFFGSALLLVFLQNLILKEFNKIDVWLLIFLMVFSSFIALSLSLVAIRTGLSVFFLLASLYAWKKNIKLISLMLLILAVLSHRVALLNVGFLFFGLFILKYWKRPIVVFAFLIFVPVIQSSSVLIQYFSKGDSYSADYEVGVRFDFLFVLFFPVFFYIFEWVVFLRRKGFAFFAEEPVFKFYVSMLIGFLVFYPVILNLPYQDRFFSFLWIMSPLFISSYLHVRLVRVVSSFVFIFISLYLTLSR